MSDLFDRLSSMSPRRLALLAIDLQERLDAAERARTEPIAIIGMGCRLPGASGVDAYWEMLSAGVDAIREIPRSRWDVDELYDPDPDAPGRIATRWAGLLDDIDRFEPELFGISPREARTMDPQQRLLLEVAWESLEDAGIAPDSLDGTPTGVYVGTCNADYAQLLMEGDPAQFDMYLSTGNASSVASGRLSYVFGLQGPAVTVDTACSSSLVAVHLAVQGLRTGACRLALAGGVNVLLSAKTTMTLSRAKMMAADGRCKTFDAAADGFVRGEGCGLVVLKRLSDARADGDRVLATIRGSATNQDGRSNGLTAPNGPSQTAVIRAALADAGVDPAVVGYVEAHGTGTSLGDPIEAQAIGAALGGDRGPMERVYVGSAKTNVGHLESAAGIAGLIKTVLMLRHRSIPPSLHFHEPSPLIPWERLPIVVPTSMTPWTSSDRPRVAGVSSFGFSGSNAHVVVQEAAPVVVEPTSDRATVVKLSARSEASLVALAERWAGALGRDPGVPLPGVARTANRGRADLPYRLAVVAEDVDELRHALAAWSGGPHDELVVAAGLAPARPPARAWLFTGHGSQYAGMGAGLYASEPVFRDAIDRCAAALEAAGDGAGHVAPKLLDVLDGPRSDALLGDMAAAQPAVFALEYALATLWRSWGVTPSMVAGHSVGEYVAAVVAGVMSVEDGMRLVAARGRLMASLPADGEMATVLASLAEVEPVLAAHGGRVSVAAINGPVSLALSGTGGALGPVLDELRSNGVEVRPLAIPVAAHSPQVEPILDELERVASAIEYHRPEIDVVSGMTGRIAEGDDLVTPAYWRAHLRHPVRFADAVVTMHDRGVRTWLEIGPHPTLLNMSRHIVPEHDSLWLPSLRSGHDDRRQILGSLGRLYVAGVAIDWDAVVMQAPSVAMPTYEFDRARHWALDGGRRDAAGPRVGHPLLGAPLQSPAMTGVVHESHLGATWPPYLDHHRVFGVAILPSPAYLEMALVAAGPGEWAIEGFEIREAMVLPDDGERTVQVVVSEPAPAGRRFEIVSRHSTGDNWVRHATGRLVGRSAVEPSTGLDRVAVQERCEERVDGQQYYQHLADVGLEFGTDFRGVRELWRRDGEVLGRIELPESLTRDVGSYRFHPALLDACFHVLGAALPADQEPEAYLLIAIDELRWSARPGTTVWNHVVLRESSTGDGVLTADIALYADDGSSLGWVSGVHLRRADRDALKLSVGGGRLGLVYDVRWQPFKPSSDVPADPAERWILVGDAPSLVPGFTDTVPGAGVVEVGRDLDALVDELDRATDEHVRVILGIDPAVSAEDAVAFAVEVARTVVGHGGVLWMVTRDGQPVGGVVPDPAQAALWGFGRVVAVEHPDHWGGLLDVHGPPGHDQVALASAAMRDVGDEDQFVVRIGTIFVPRVVARPAPTPAPAPIRRERSYLITGGLGGLGLRLAAWMAACGASTVVLTGRNGLPDASTWDDAGHSTRTVDQINAVRAIEAAGATVVVVSVDVTDRDAMAGLFGRFGDDLPPLGGIVHAAATLSNVLVADMARTDVVTMMRPKTIGTELLDELSAEHDLDFFVLFSSTTALWGSRHLGHYAAANHYLDAVAHRRRAHGRPALSVNWGTWDEMRVASDTERDTVVGTGMRPMPTELATSVLGSLLAAADVAQVVVADVDWAMLRTAYEARRPRPLLAELGRPARTTAHARGAGVPALAEALAELDASARSVAVVSFLQVEVARALGLEAPERIDPDQGLFEMGMDSLMSVELKGRLESAIGRDLPSTLTFNHPNISAIARFVVDQILSPARTDSAASLMPGDGGSLRPEISCSSAGDERFDDLSEEDLAATLARRLADL